MYITNVVIGILFIETVYILIPLFISLYVNGFETEVVLNPGLFNGLTGNKNIAKADSFQTTDFNALGLPQAPDFTITAFQDNHMVPMIAALSGKILNICKAG